MSNSKLIVINSADRLSPLENSNQFTIRIRPAIVNACHILLAFCIIPNSTYNITSNNNKLSFDDGSVITISIPPGSYNVTNLASTIAAAMTAAGSQTYTVIYNPITYHYTISATNPFALLYDFFTSTTIYPTLGYRFNTNSVFATSHEGNSAVSLWASPYFTIRIDKVPFTVQTSQSANNFGTFVINNNQLQDGSIIQWTKSANYNEFSNINVNIDTLFIELRDYLGNLADINQSEWSMGLRISY